MSGNTAALSPLTVVRRACTEQCKLLQLATGQSLQFTGMGGPMGVYENYDTCDPRARPLVPAAAVAALCCDAPAAVHGGQGSALLGSLRRWAGVESVGTWVEQCTVVASARNPAACVCVEQQHLQRRGHLLRAARQ